MIVVRRPWLLSATLLLALPSLTMLPLHAADAPADATTLDNVEVRAPIAKRSQTATKTDTPLLEAPQSISTKHSIVVPCFSAAAERSATFATSSTQTMIRAPCFGRRARRSILAGSRTWFDTSTSPMPPRTNTSASLTFWQQTPQAPPSST